MCGISNGNKLANKHVLADSNLACALQMAIPANPGVCSNENTTEGFKPNFKHAAVPDVSAITHRKKSSGCNPEVTPPVDQPPFGALGATLKIKQGESRTPSDPALKCHHQDDERRAPAIAAQYSFGSHV